MEERLSSASRETAQTPKITMDLNTLTSLTHVHYDEHRHIVEVRFGSTIKLEFFNVRAYQASDGNLHIQSAINSKPVMSLINHPCLFIHSNQFMEHYQK